MKIVVPERVNFPLTPISVGRASAFEADIEGLPDDVDNVQIAIGNPSDATTSVVAGIAKPDGSWKVYVNGLYFTTEGSAVYYLTGKTAKGDNIYFGKGTLTIVPSVLNASSASSSIPDDTYVRNPTTGLWHKLTITTEDDRLVAEIDTEGITR